MAVVCRTVVCCSFAHSFCFHIGLSAAQCGVACESVVVEVVVPVERPQILCLILSVDVDEDDNGQLYAFKKLLFKNKSTSLLGC